MELRQLRYFVAVAEELHFSRAAARLLIAGPSLSQQIKALERELSLVLFERSSKGVTLTQSGELLLPHARATLDAAGELQAAARRATENRATLLRLGFLGFTLTSTTRGLLTEFGRAVSDVTVQMRQYEWSDPAAGLLVGETDAAFVRPPFTGEDDLTMVELARERLLAVVAEDHELASAEAVSRSRLAQEPWLEADIVSDPVFADYWYLREHRAGAAVVRSRASTLEEWLSEIAFGHGVNVVPAGLAEEYRRSGIAFVPVSDAPESRLVLAWRGAEPPEAVAALARLASGRRQR